MLLRPDPAQRGRPVEIRGLATGMSEAAGYAALTAARWITGRRTQRSGGA
ncbi:hypothetical protein NRK68_35845 (plasmid) [Streptomyces yangpuensis]|uniref:Uncharacterized protein n=1 Tax=Streptomyces yangpuensis TaxID=1648182 RepID=A0ABY5Q8W8_9ACTN|nr:hypothetical protein [Streptomyces yangpuensis]MBZ9599570.1 hypothetical protein [Streptomyces erythrochromogenes]UUY52630.1 hypothetical protein NRK68_35845 [Streptomyces yangpuensis]